MRINSRNSGRAWGSQRHGARPSHGRPTPRRRSSVPRLEVLEDSTVLSPLMVMSSADSGPGSLRDTIAAAPIGATIEFAKGVHTITLTSSELAITKSPDIEGLGENQLTIERSSAMDTPSFRIFDISGTGVTVTIAGLTIANGNAQGGDGEAGRGGGILMESGTTLTLTSCTLENNQALGGTNAPGEGGAIYMENGTTLTVDQSHLQNNTALGGSAPAVFAGVPGVVDHGGGAINNVGGQLAITDSDFEGNLAQGGPGVIGGFGVGGAINNEAGATLTVASSTFAHNRAVGGPGRLSFSNGSGYGGALFNLNATLITTDGLTQITNNRAGSDTTFGSGGGLFSLGGSVSLNHARIMGNTASIPLFNDVFILFSTINTSG